MDHSQNRPGAILTGRRRNWDEEPGDGDKAGAPEPAEPPEPAGAPEPAETDLVFPIVTLPS
jgi:hypothetical protein